MQFRTIDWGMENCTLHIQMPSDKGDFYPTDAGSRSAAVNLSRLQIERPLDYKIPSFWSQKINDHKIATIDIIPGFSWARQFDCGMDSLHTFALASSTSKVHVEWWQDKQSLKQPGTLRTDETASPNNFDSHFHYAESDRIAYSTNHPAG